MDYTNQKVFPMESDNSSMNYGSLDPTKYAMLSENGGTVRPPPYRRNIPLYHSKSPPKKGGSCVKYLLWCCFFLFILIFILVSIFSFIYGLYKPKIPSYKVEGLQVNAFNLQPDFSLYIEFIMNVKAENPNEKISISYGKDSSVIVNYRDARLCSGKLPAFHQGRKNTTMMNVVLRGKPELEAGFQEGLVENLSTGRIPLLIMLKAPLSILLGELAIRDIVVLTYCYLVVDNLSPTNKIGIVSSRCEASVTL